MSAKRIGVFGWGIVAPKSPNIEAFRKNLATGTSWLSPFNGYGPDNFLVGNPEFHFEDYRPWIDARFAPRHFRTLEEKMDMPVQYALGAFIQALGQNPGLEQELHSLGRYAHVYAGTGLGSLGEIHDASLKHYKRQRAWNRFWSAPERNAALREYKCGADPNDGVPPCPDKFAGDPSAREDAEDVWFAYWAERSDQLRDYLAELADIEGSSIQEGDIEAAKLSTIREREKRRAKLKETWGVPDAPWHVSANVIWNIPNVPASQISILGRITGLAFAPVAACSTFGVALKLAMDAIHSGDAKAVVVGATDSPPNPLTVGAFHSARVLSAGHDPSVPLTRLKGTHVAGGAIIWIVGDMDYMKSKGFHPLGMEPVSAGVSSDADHIITPSADGPRTAIQQAIEGAGAKPSDIGTWDLHATATPGDFMEVSTLRSVLGEDVLVSARKGTFGHGMSAGGGWELTAQYLGYQEGHIFPTPLRKDELNVAISAVHDKMVFESPCELPPGLAGKISMGIGGINACIISRPLDPSDK
ncbi:MAG TPA: beta-ketoacyl synthase N-terminal-like domain-containing protein [Bryobacteraceae bacterium]|jgi:3-oxoacyl-(acyl-carrier-protein) synthase